MVLLEQALAVDQLPGLRHDIHLQIVLILELDGQQVLLLGVQDQSLLVVFGPLLALSLEECLTLGHYLPLVRFLSLHGLHLLGLVVDLVGDPGLAAEVLPGVLDDGGDFLQVVLLLALGGEELVHFYVVPVERRQHSVLLLVLGHAPAIGNQHLVLLFEFVELG